MTESVPTTEGVSDAKLAFEAWAKPRGLDLEFMAPDAWGTLVYGHPHILSLWHGFEAGFAAARRTAPQAEADGVEELPPYVVHGDEPMTPEGKVAVEAVVRAAASEIAHRKAWASAVRTLHKGMPLWVCLADKVMGPEEATAFVKAYALALRPAQPEAGVTGWRFVLHPMETFPADADEPAEIDVHEGSVAVVLGTNAKPIGWIDTHATFEGKTYRDRLIPPAALEAAP